MKRNFSDCLHAAQRDLLLEYAWTLTMSAMEDIAKAFAVAQDLPADLRIKPPAKATKLRNYFASELIEAFEQSLEFVQDWPDSLDEFHDLLNSTVGREAHEDFIVAYEGISDETKEIN